jgi:hypothetical protein
VDWDGMGVDMEEIARVCAGVREWVRGGYWY